MPVGEPRLTRALFVALKNEPLVTEVVQSIILKKTVDYAQNHFGLSIPSYSIDESERQLVEDAENHRTEDAVVYGIYKGESTLAGANGVISRRLAKESTKDVFRQLGVGEMLKDSQNILEVVKKFAEIMAMAGHISKEKTVINDLGDRGVEMILSGSCPHLEVCQLLQDEGVYDVFGNIPCSLALAFAAAAEIVFGTQYDITIKERNPPNCKAVLHEL